MNILTICDQGTAIELNKNPVISNNYFVCNFKEKSFRKKEELKETENFKILNYHRFKFGTFDKFINWNEIPPLDAYILEYMGQWEAYVLKMYERVSKINSHLYDTRKIQYLNHLRFWNYFLDKNNIDMFYSSSPPHIGFDFIIYGLCKLKGIKTVNLIRMFNFAYIIDDIWYLFDKRKLLNKKIENDFELCKFKDIYEVHRKHETPEKDVTKPLVIPRINKQKKIIKKTKSIIKFYNANTVIPDLKEKYIYVPLHYQPEGTTCPMGGYFVDQILMLEILNRLNITIYLKEHPRMSKNRSIPYYGKILKLKNIKFINVEYNPYELIDNSFTIATVTGLTAFESILRGKTALIFGNTFTKYMPGGFSVRSLEDTEEAIKNIDTFKFKENKLKTFLYNFENNFLFDFENFNKSYKNIVNVLKIKLNKINEENERINNMNKDVSDLYHHEMISSYNNGIFSDGYIDEEDYNEDNEEKDNE